MQNPRRFLNVGLIPPIGILVLALVLAIHSMTSEEATAGNIQYRACDFVIEAPTPQEKGDIRVTQLIEHGVEPSLEIGVLGEPDTIVSIDPTDDIVAEAAVAADARLQPVLDTLRPEPLDPDTAPWPYTNTVQRPPVYQDKGILRYRFPDPGSGIVVSTMHPYMTDGSIAATLDVANCRSIMRKMVEFREGTEPKITDLTDSDDVHPDDQAAFKTFYEELTIQEPAR